MSSDLGTTTGRYGPDVRVIHRGEHVVVQQLVGGLWEDHVAYNEISNDFAYTEARNAARALQFQLMRIAAGARSRQ